MKFSIELIVFIIGFIFIIYNMLPSGCTRPECLTEIPGFPLILFIGFLFIVIGSIIAIYKFWKKKKQSK